MAQLTDAERAARVLAALAREAGSPEHASELERLSERARAGRFYVAVVGQFKRGKSTLINALLGRDLLPAGVAPVTSVVTVVRWGPGPRATVYPRHADPREIAVTGLRDYVTEEGNPGNARAVRAVEIEWPVELLRTGLCLVDTPGVGSVLAANARETQAFLPHIDAALLVLGADPPITADELALGRELAAQRIPLVVVVNKADIVSPTDLDAAVAFTRRVLVERMRLEPLILTAAARWARERR
ncbi:MAG TPA: dynamin family protein, partial [Gemmatimonadales bacterium]|nr:dynamin family protein [Gemmatimonadales bacterium]